MAGMLAGGLLQTTFAAVSFAGAGFLFSKMNHSGYKDEIKRHNHALENLQKAKEKFYENEIKNKDRIMELRQELLDANADINRTNAALQEIGKLEEYDYNNRTFHKEPTLADFYKPSDAMKKYENVFSVIMGTATGYLLEKAMVIIL